MTDPIYKEYSLSNLRNWISDALGSGDATAKEIYDTILEEVEDYTNCHKRQYENALELQSLMKGHRPSVSFEREVWESKVEEDIITGEQWITFPPELMEKLGWKEGDDLEWIDNYDGTFTIRKV
jgi:N-acetylglucosamine kinase-like BadF-type ATPase